MALEDFIDNDICVAWDTLAMNYLAHGLSVIPLAPKQKGPKLAGWSAFCENQMDPEFAKSFYGKNHNIGLCLGEASGLMAVDVDTDDEKLLSAIGKILPFSPVKKKGAKGYTAFYKYEGQTSQSFKNGKDGIDILCHGRQTVLPDSIHPSGIKYTWLTEKTLLDVPKDDFPSISETCIGQLRALFKPKEKPVPVAPRRSYREAQLDEIEEALRHIDPDYSYEQWIEIGMAIKSELGANGFEVFNRWSAGGEKYDGVSKTWAKYNSFDVRDITIATLFHHAIEGGYEQKNSTWEIEGIIGDEEDQKEAWVAVNTFLGLTDKKQKEQEQIKSTLMDPPGLLGEVHDWITKCSPVVQPMYSIASAISFVSVVYAQKFKTDTNARSNNYVIAIGASGSGKSKVCDLVPYLMQQLPTPYPSLQIGEPKSDAGLVDAMIDRSGRALLFIDEIGHYLRQIKSGSANAYTANIGAEFTKFFSRADGVYMSAAYSQNSKKASVAIQQPCLVIFGQSVSERVFKSLNEDDFIDGFFNRWLIFESKDKIPPQNTDYVDKDINYPRNLIKFIERMDKWVVEAQLSSNLMKTTTGPYALIVPKTEGAKEMIAKYSADINKRRTEESVGLLDYPLSRACEHMEKLSLIAAEFREERPIITERSVAWAIAAVEHNLAQIADKLNAISSSDYEETTMKMLRAIPIGKQLSQAAFNRYAKAFPPKQRREIMNDLLVQGYLAWDNIGDGKQALVRKK